jgi:hypothetical protein
VVQSEHPYAEPRVALRTVEHLAAKAAERDVRVLLNAAPAEHITMKTVGNVPDVELVREGTLGTCSRRSWG